MLLLRLSGEFCEVNCKTACMCCVDVLCEWAVNKEAEREANAASEKTDDGKREETRDCLVRREEEAVFETCHVYLNMYIWFYLLCLGQF